MELGPDDGLRQRAMDRFARIRAESLGRLRPDASPNPTVHFTDAVPAGLCVSTVARLATNAPHLLPLIGEMQSGIALAGPAWHYQPESIHLSLLGMTQRQVGDFDEVSLRWLRDIVTKIFAETEPIQFDLHQLNLQNNQWFIEAIAGSTVWARLRTQLGDAVRAEGGDPMTHPDSEPTHINIARMNGDADAHACAELLTASQQLQFLTVSHVDVVITDFTLTPSATQFIDTIHLGEIRS
jgi:hypothetical protein